MNLRRTLQTLLILSVAGLSIALYLTWVYTIDVAPICIGGGGCDTVQHSPYAWVAGIPVPALGAAVYVALIGLTVAALRWPERREMLLLGLFGMSLAGVLFSAYLTYLELFVILAICTWCVASAVLMVLIFGLAIAAHRQYSQEA